MKNFHPKFGLLALFWLVTLVGFFLGGWAAGRANQNRFEQPIDLQVADSVEIVEISIARQILVLTPNVVEISGSNSGLSVKAVKPGTTWVHLLNDHGNTKMFFRVRGPNKN